MGRPLSPPRIPQKSFECWATSTKQLLNAGKGPQVPRKAAHSLQKEVHIHFEYWEALLKCLPVIPVSIPVIYVRAVFQHLSNEVSVNYLVLLFYCEIDDLFTFSESSGIFTGNWFLFFFTITETVNLFLFKRLAFFFLLCKKIFRAE